MSTSTGTPSQTTGEPVDRFVGMSIGDREIQLVLVDADRRVVDACSIDTPASSVIDGTIVDPSRLARLLQVVGAELGLAGMPAVVALRPSGSSVDVEPHGLNRVGAAGSLERLGSGLVARTQQAVARRIAAAAGLTVLRVEHALHAAVRGLAPGVSATGLVLLPTPAPGLALVTARGELVTGTVWRATDTEPQFWPMEPATTDLLLRGGLEQRIELLTRIIQRQTPVPVPARRAGDGLAADSPSPLPTFLAALGAAVAACDTSATDNDTLDNGGADAMTTAGASRRSASIVASPTSSDPSTDATTLGLVPLDPPPPPTPTPTSAQAVGTPANRLFGAWTPSPNELAADPSAPVVDDPADATCVVEWSQASPPPTHPAGPVHPLFSLRDDDVQPPVALSAPTAARTSTNPERTAQRRRVAAAGIVAVALAAGLLAVSRARDDDGSQRVDLVDDGTTSSSDAAAGGTGPTATLVNAGSGQAAPVTLPADAAATAPDAATAPTTVDPAATPSTVAAAPAASPTTVSTSPSSTPTTPTTPTTVGAPVTSPAPTTTEVRTFPARAIDGVPVNSAQVLDLDGRNDADFDDAAAALAEILTEHPSWSVRLIADGSAATQAVAADLAGRVVANGIESARVVVEPTGAASGTLTIWVVAPDA